MLACVASLLAGCGSSSKATASSTVWLCRPGMANDPCTVNLNATVVGPTGARTAQPAQPAANPPYDCFYVYPTVSAEKGDNADLAVQPAETFVAIEQAARFSQVCRVWSPMYRQATLRSIADGKAITANVNTIAYNSLLSGWQDYLEHDNHGRPIIFIGHSQGAAMLIQLLQRQVDGNAALRARTVSAIVLGGNVVVPTGKTVGGSFQHLPACQSVHSTGCVIAYSSFSTTPPTNSLFGRPGQGVSLQAAQTDRAGLQVVCVNPADIGGKPAPLDPYFGVPAASPGGQPSWYTYPDLYSAGCTTGNGATWLQVNDIAAPGDKRPRVTAADGPAWGLHVDDVNLALGNLVNDVRQQEAAWHSAHH